MREQSQTQKIEDILGAQERARLRDGLDPELMKKGEEIVDFFYTKGENFDLDELEIKHRLLAAYIFIPASKLGYIWYKMPGVHYAHVSEMTLSKDAKHKRQIENLKNTIAQQKRKIASLKKEKR